MDLEWEVGLFHALRRLWRAVTPGAPPPPPGAVALEVVRGRLVALASMLAGAPVRVLPARGEGGVRGWDLLLPEHIAVSADGESNAGLYILRAVVGGAQLRTPRPDAPADPLGRDLEHVRRAIDVASADLGAFATSWRAACNAVLAGRPGLATLRGRALQEEQARQALLRGAPIPPVREVPSSGPASPPVPLWGRWFAPDDASEAPLPLEGARAPTDGAELEAPPVTHVRRVQLNREQQSEAVLQHTFEKVDVAESFSGGMRPEDGADELDAHAEALRELDLQEVVRGGETGSVYHSDIALDADVPDVESVGADEVGVAYPEWDARAGAFRPGWCTVYPSPVPAARPKEASAALLRQRGVVERLARQLEDHRTRMALVDRQPEGDELDLVAVVDNVAARAAGRAGTNRLYCRPARRRRDVATTVLLDVSLSADAWIADRRVLDISRDAVLALGEVADRLGDRLQVLAFASNTRRCCRVWSVKGWADPWVGARGRLYALEAQGYTRMGPALRHATAGLGRIAADRRLLLLISDGKPTDQDRYEGRHGIADVRMALREAQQIGVSTHALAVDARARDHLPALFGDGAWHILPSPDLLPAALGDVYAGLVR